MFLTVAINFLLLASALAQQVTYVTTLQPFRFILEEIAGSRARVHALLPPGASPHTHQPRPSDVRAVEQAAALLMGGRGLDDWARELPCRRLVTLIDLLPEDSLLHIAPHGKAEVSGSDHAHVHAGVDPHFWTDPLLVRALVPVLVDSLCRIDPPGCQQYRANAAAFAQSLDSLTVAIATSLKGARGARVVLAHPFFNYFLRRFGIEVVGTVEVAAGSEPSPRDLQRLLATFRAKGVEAIFTHPQLPDRAARVLAEAAGVPVYQLDPLGGGEGKATYEQLLWYNARILAKVLQ